MPYLPLLLFAAIYGFAALSWKLPPLVGLAYLAVSLGCFLAYAIDKSAARNKSWRTPEAWLLLLGLVGGWPGGLLAQQWLRHKTSKVSFQWKFHVSVAVNIGLFVYLSRQLAAPAID
ncbi:DUF1294 domain-containing protein [Massilia agri]|uniref:DUF1294 domain-containing protein n=1 Tax=Massilia agri TaxID=1886785 RepID=A0ABT2ANL0_9BURK|nr:DUF1294 domain-containing protein [Massilia agri]MCS0597736.1 DUF1294 domain-containing protein [Massilia agri]